MLAPMRPVAAPSVQLKMNAQVMLLRNLELSGGASRMLVNGRRVSVCATVQPCAFLHARSDASFDVAAAVW